MKKQSFAYRFLLRWFVCGLGLWIAAGLLGSVNYTGSVWVIVMAGLLLAVLNSIVRPLLIFFSLPAVLVTLGLFLIVINGFTVWLVSWLYEPLEVLSFWGAMLAGVIIGLVNYLVTAILESNKQQ
jgi:putative membrane protein